MNRRRFFKLAVGLLGALALPVPKFLSGPNYWEGGGTSQDNASIWITVWNKTTMNGAFPVAKLRVKKDYDVR
jgi:hypothetical protein